MSWRRLLPVSLVCAFVAGGIITAVAPSPAAAETGSCGLHPGELCSAICTLCHDTGYCCTVVLNYYPQ